MLIVNKGKKEPTKEKELPNQKSMKLLGEKELQISKILENDTIK